MVQPLNPTTAGGRPDYALFRAGHKPITTGKYEEFRSHLHKALELPASLQQRSAPPENASPGKLPPEREMSPGFESSRSLAPEDQPSLGRAGADLAEWFSLINPAGGVESALPVQAQASSHPGVAEVAELVERWVRRVALGGDQRRGALRLDIGQGRFSGAELTVVAEAGHVSVELQLPAELSQGDLSERLRQRLERRGFAADVVVR